MAGKKGKCKCGSVMSIPAQPMSATAKPAQPAPPPPPPADDIYDVGDDAPVAAPAYTPAPTTPAPAPAAKGTAFSKVVVERDDAAPKRELKWGAALKWYGMGMLFLAWAFWELSSPTESGRRGIRAVLMIVNMLHPMGGFFLLLALALFFLVVGTLILLGKAKDADYEHEQKQNEWVSSRGKRR